MNEKVRIQDDLYMHVNGEWIEKAIIPDDKPMVGGFSDLDEDVTKILMEDFTNLSTNKMTSEISEMNEAVKLYKVILDTKKRNELGIKPALKYLDIINNLKDVNDLNKDILDYFLKGLPLPIVAEISPDMKNTKVNSFCIAGQDTILPDTTYYNPQFPQKEQMLGLYKMMLNELYKDVPLDEELKQIFINDTFEYDELIAKTVKSNLEKADYVNFYNPTSLEEVNILLNPLDFKGLLSKLYDNKLPENIIVFDPRALKELNSHFNNDNFEKFKHWAYSKQLVKSASLLSEELEFKAGIYSRALMGIKDLAPLDKRAYLMASRIFSEPVGVYYGRKYFGEEAKADVINIVKNIIETYKKRVANNSFLSKNTKEKAILKLSTIEIKMGYPDVIDPFYSELTVDENKSYFENMANLSYKLRVHSFNKLYKEVDKKEWAMPGHMVNACYNPFSNDITFPSGILQKPFYSIHQSISENLGGIGAVIGHEISHAFDNNGSHFDENGNLCNWWSKEDFEAFEILTKKMVEQYDGLEVGNGKVNGQLVVSENIADNGGMAVSLDIMSRLPNPNYQEYFINWAKIWCIKMSEQMQMLLLSRDVHSPALVRGNIPPRNFSEWYKAFDVKESDLMYLPKDKRIIIW